MLTEVFGRGKVSLKVCSDRAKGKFSFVSVSLFFPLRTVNDVSGKLANDATSAE